MDKIINGVDVSECSYYSSETYPYTCEVWDNECEAQNCYYKQLKRLQHYQAEFEHELMNDYTYDGYISPNGFTTIDVIKHIKLELKRLEQENERLKEEKQELNIEIVSLTSKLFTLEKSSNDLSQGVNKLYKALQEIRGITREWLNNDWSCFHCRSNMDDKLKDILDKINEVIGAEG